MITLHCSFLIAQAVIKKEAKEGRGKDWEARGAERLLSWEDSKQRAPEQQAAAQREGRKREPGRLHAGTTSRARRGFQKARVSAPWRATA